MRPYHQALAWLSEISSTNISTTFLLDVPFSKYTTAADATLHIGISPQTGIALKAYSSGAGGRVSKPYRPSTAVYHRDRSAPSRHSDSLQADRTLITSCSPIDLNRWLGITMSSSTLRILTHDPSSTSEHRHTHPPLLLLRAPSTQSSAVFYHPSPQRADLSYRNFTCSDHRSFCLGYPCTIYNSTSLVLDTKSVLVREFPGEISWQGYYVCKICCIRLDLTWTF